MSTLKQKYRSNEVVVNNKSNFKSHLVKCQSILDNIQFEDLVLRAMGRAVERASNLATQLNANNYNTFEITKKEYLVEILEDKPRMKLMGTDRDEFDPDSLEIKDRKLLKMPAVEITIHKSKLESSRIKKAQNLFEHNKK